MHLSPKPGRVNSVNRARALMAVMAQKGCFLVYVPVHLGDIWVGVVTQKGTDGEENLPLAKAHFCCLVQIMLSLSRCPQL